MMNSQHSCHREAVGANHGKSHSSRVGLVILMAFVVQLFFLSLVSGNEGGPGQTGRFYPGVVTGISQKFIQVNNTDYAVTKDVTIRDDNGRLREWKDLWKGLRVEFHLSQGRIDQIVRILPR